MLCSYNAAMTVQPFMPWFAADTYIQRRRALRAGLAERGVTSGKVLLIANIESPRNYPANCYPFRQDSSWLYFMGLGVPGHAAVIDLMTGDTTLFADDIDLASIIWTGDLPSREELRQSCGAEHGAPLSEVARLADAARSGHIHCLPFSRPDQQRRLADLLGIAEAEVATLVSAPLVAATVSLREIKEPQEIAEMEKACAITADIHAYLLQHFQEGWTELQAAHLVRERAAAYGCELSFATIATCRGSVLHNMPTAYRAGAGDIFLLDAGVEVPSGYAGDQTTTFPVGRRFSPEVRDLYQVLYMVFRQAVAQLGPGRRFLDIHLATCLALANGLKDLGILKGEAEGAVEDGSLALFFPHGLGHMIGLDVHDMEGLGEDAVGYGQEVRRSEKFGLRSLRLAKTLRAGMVHSVEPGLYFIPQLLARAEAGNFRTRIQYDKVKPLLGIGMRIEEDWLITEEGARRLGPELDRSIAALERARMAS